MNKKTHRIFGKIIYEYLADNYGIVLNRSGFILGNISPDLTFSFVVYPHEREHASGLVKRRIANLIVKDSFNVFDDSFLFSQTLGSLCHYISDFFCEAHTERWNGSLKEHILCERELYYYTRFHEKEIRESIGEKMPLYPMSAGEIFKEVEMRNDVYLEGEPSCRAQAEGAVTTCIYVVGSIMAARYALAWNATPGFVH